MRRRLKELKLILIILSLTFCVSQNSWAWTERYIGNDGVDQAGCGSAAGASACNTIQYYLTTIGASGGERVNVKNDKTYVKTDALSSCLESVVGATLDLPIIIQGYSSTIGDGGQAILDGESTALYTAFLAHAYWILRDIELKGSTNDAVYTGGAMVVLEGCKISHSGDDGTGGGTSSYLLVLGCEITGTGVAASDAGLHGLGHANYFYNYIHDLTGHGIYPDYYGSSVVGNIIDTVSASGVYLNSGEATVIAENTIYNAVDGISCSSANEYVNAVNNIFNTLSDKAYDIPAGANFLFYGYNNRSSETNASSGLIHIDLGGEDTSDPTFDDAPNQDFNIGALDDTGYPGIIGSSTNTREIGALPLEETGGGTTSYGFIQ